MAAAIQQRRVLFTGRVQGVGFRYTTRQVATGLQVTGFVRNLPDGRVELVAEGEGSQIEALLSGVREHLGGNIRSEQTDTLPATGQFQSFEITH